jgi:hypothetical protein
MTKGPLAMLWLCIAACVASTARGADPVPGIHGMADVFAAPGVAIAWGMRHGPDEASAIVVIRILADAPAFASVAVSGSDPFTRQAKLLLPPTPSRGAVDVRVPRAHFAEFPRSEIRLYDAASPMPSATPTLVVFYLGVPDTTPESASEAALEASLTERLARLRGATGSKPP